MSNDLRKIRLVNFDKNDQKELADLLKEAAEEIQNIYGYDTDLTERLYCKINEIEQIETSYDVDKVVQQLSCENCGDCLLEGNCTANLGDGFMEKIREIVKAGGVDE